MHLGGWGYGSPTRIPLILISSFADPDMNLDPDTPDEHVFRDPRSWSISERQVLEDPDPRIKPMDMQIRIRMQRHTKKSWIRTTPFIEHIIILILVRTKTYVDIHTFQPCRTSQLQKQHLPEENPGHQGRGTSASDLQIEKGCPHLHCSPGPHCHYGWNKVS